MHRTLALLLLAIVAAAPLAVAEGNGAPLPDVPDAPPTRGALDAAADAAADAGEAVADAGAAAVAFAGDAIGAVADGAKALAGAIGKGLVALAKGVGALLGWVAGLVGAAFGALADLAAALGGLLARGAKTAAAHPKETAIVAGSATGLGSILWLLKRLGFLAGLPLYTRLLPGEMLDNEQRARVYERIRAQPGAHPSQIAEDLGLGWGTVVYHLARLEEGKLVTCKSYNNRKCYFAIGSALDAQARTAVAAMGSDPARRIVEAVAASPGITQKDLASAVGISQALASWHVKRLVASGVLLAERAGRSNSLRVAAHVPLAAAMVVA